MLTCNNQHSCSIDYTDISRTLTATRPSDKSSGRAQFDSSNSGGGLRKSWSRSSDDSSLERARVSAVSKSRKYEGAVSLTADLSAIKHRLDSGGVRELQVLWRSLEEIKFCENFLFHLLANIGFSKLIFRITFEIENLALKMGLILTIQNANSIVLSQVAEINFDGIFFLHGSCVWHSLHDSV